MANEVSTIFPPIPATTWRSWMVLVCVLVVALFLFFPVAFRVRLPTCGRKNASSTISIPIELSFWSSPWIAILLLVASTAIPWSVVRDGIIGRTDLIGATPYDVVLLVLSCAYISVSMDFHGTFHRAAARIMNTPAMSTGTRLYFAVSIFSLVVTACLSNDVVVLTLTPVLQRAANEAGIDPLPYLLAMFFAANTGSMFLYVGNPSNIVASLAYGVNFERYSIWMLLVSFVASSIFLGTFYYLHRSKFRRDKIREWSPADDEKSDRSLSDRMFSVYGTIIFIGCLIAVMVLSFWPQINLSFVTVPCAFLVFVWDLVVDLRENYMSSTETIVEKGVPDSPIVDDKDDTSRIRKWIKQLVRGKVRRVLAGIPWVIAPFLIGMYILVEALDHTNWTARLAWLLGRMPNNAFLISIVIGFLSVILCSVLNSIPMTVFMTRVIIDPHFRNYPGQTPAGNTAALFALIAGGNLGANLTLAGSLAGILWYSQLPPGQITSKQFTRDLLVPLIVVTVATCITLAVEVDIFPDILKQQINDIK